MWIVRWTFIALIILIILGFSLQNTDLVKVTIWTWESSDIPLYLVVYFSFAAGILAFLIVAVVNQLQNRLEVRRHRREIKQLRGELDRLRTISLSEEIDENLPDEDYPDRQSES